MNLDALKNMDVNDLLEKLKGQSHLLKDKKLLTKVGLGLGSILIFLIIYYGFVNPLVQEQNIKLAEMNENKNNITTFGENIIKLNQVIKKIQPEFEKNSKLFHSAEEVEGLYQNISNFAISNGLNIINLKVQEKKPVMKKIQQSQDQSQEQSQEQQNNQQDPNAPQVEYFKIPVAFEIQGNYLGYLKFRRALSKSNKVINFDNEKITVNDKGGISSKGTLSIVGLPGQYDK
ncbi:MAG: pilus assembly protein PilO [Candidatus Puniceispirillales bacterium]|jgi:Tfp pilus assembly protein PilO|tara:strand:- start:514 stop:1206 length:693 start_codon:yes stop_codon:yes gene_type:complete